MSRFSAIVSFTETPQSLGQTSPGSFAVLRCCGDEDRTTQGHRRRAITRALRAQTDVVVDLSELGFADVSLLVDLAVLARRLRAGGRAIRIRGAQPQIRTLIELVGIHRLPGVVVLDGPATTTAAA